MDTLSLAIAGIIALLFFVIGYTFFVPKSTRGFAPDNKEAQKEDSTLRLFTVLTNELMLTLPAIDKEPKKPKKDVATENLLIRAGNPWGLTVSEFKTMKLAGLFYGVIFGFVLGIPLSLSIPVPAWVVAALGGLLLFNYPSSKYKDLAKSRDLEFKRLLPEALDLIHIALSGGMPLARAIESAVPSMKDSIVKEEFKKLVSDVNAGETMHSSLDKFASRAPNDSIKTFARSLQSAIKTNAPMAEILESRAKASREEFFSFIHQKVAQLESKIWMILSPTMLPALMIITILPSGSIMMNAL